MAGNVLGLRSGWLELGLGLLIGVGGACLAIFAQKLAVALAGLVLGGGALGLFIALVAVGLIPINISPVDEV